MEWKRLDLIFIVNNEKVNKMDIKIAFKYWAIVEHDCELND